VCGIGVEYLRVNLQEEYPLLAPWYSFAVFCGPCGQTVQTLSSSSSSEIALSLCSVAYAVRRCRHLGRCFAGDRML
jgi:hypothetical protein